MARAAVVLLSHRPTLLPRAVRSVLRQTIPVQLVVQHDRDAWREKFNDAVRPTRSEFIIPLCDDDTLHPTYAARCLEFADEGDIIFTDRTVWWSGWVDLRDPRTWLHRHPIIGRRHYSFGRNLPKIIAQKGMRATRVDAFALQTFQGGSPLPMTCCIRRSLWDALGGYDDILHADTDFWYRALKHGARIVYVPEALFNYTYHRRQLSREVPTNGRAAVAFHRKHFADFGWLPVARVGDELRFEIVPEEHRKDWTPEALDRAYAIA